MPIPNIEDVALLPCPFCGNAGDILGEVVNDDGSLDPLYQAQMECWMCGALGPKTAWYPTKKAALKWLRKGHNNQGWNTRAHLTKEKNDGK